MKKDKVEIIFLCVRTDFHNCCQTLSQNSLKINIKKYDIPIIKPMVETHNMCGDDNHTTQGISKCKVNLNIIQHVIPHWHTVFLLYKCSIIMWTK